MRVEKEELAKSYRHQAQISLEPTGPGARRRMSILLRRMIHGHLRRSHHPLHEPGNGYPKQSSTYLGEYVSGCFKPAAWHLATSYSPRDEGILQQVPSAHALTPGPSGAARWCDGSCPRERC